MQVFKEYSKYYDLLYKDKDYAGEVEYVHNLIQKNTPGAKTILDLGCGTGRHDFLLVKKGYSVTGVDMSEQMLSIANAQLSTLNIKPETLNFKQSDIRMVRLDQTFDVVISLFHVMSYQVTNEDLKAAFATANAHLKPGGVFIFDCWYGPAVLTIGPEPRIKRIEDKKIHVTRLVEAEMWPNDNIVDVKYHNFIRVKGSNDISEIQEIHRMRFLFKQEIDLFLENTGFELLHFEEFMSGNVPGLDTWGVVFIAKVKDQLTKRK